MQLTTSTAEIVRQREEGSILIPSTALRLAARAVIETEATSSRAIFSGISLKNGSTCPKAAKTNLDPFVQESEKLTILNAKVRQQYITGRAQISSSCFNFEIRMQQFNWTGRASTRASTFWRTSTECIWKYRNNSNDSSCAFGTCARGSYTAAGTRASFS